MILVSLLREFELVTPFGLNQYIQR